MDWQGMLAQIMNSINAPVVPVDPLKGRKTTDVPHQGYVLSPAPENRQTTKMGKAPSDKYITGSNLQAQQLEGSGVIPTNHEMYLPMVAMGLTNPSLIPQFAGSEVMSQAGTKGGEEIGGYFGHPDIGGFLGGLLGLIPGGGINLGERMPMGTPERVYSPPSLESLIHSPMPKSKSGGYALVEDPKATQYGAPGQYDRGTTVLPSIRPDLPPARETPPLTALSSKTNTWEPVDTSKYKNIQDAVDVIAQAYPRAMSKLPEIRLKSTGYAKSGTRGQYSPEENKVYMNPNYFKDLDKYEIADNLSQMIEASGTLGHEMTHAVGQTYPPIGKKIGWKPGDEIAPDIREKMEAGAYHKGSEIETKLREQQKLHRRKTLGKPPLKEKFTPQELKKMSREKWKGLISEAAKEGKL